MTYHVLLQRLAITDLQSYYDYAAHRSVVDADRWLNRFHQALKTLEERPERCGLAREHDKVGMELREFLFGKRP